MTYLHLLLLLPREITIQTILNKKETNLLSHVYPSLNELQQASSHTFRGHTESNGQSEIHDIMSLTN